MLRLVQVGLGLPQSFIVDPAAEFQPGALGQLIVSGNTVMLTVSNGTAPLGIIDDIKIKAFTAVSWNEVLVIPCVGVPGPNNTLITPVDVKAELRHPYIDPKSFISTVDIFLNSTNGTVTAIAGTKLNYDPQGLGYPTAIRMIVNYSYQIPNIPGDDSTISSGRATLWFDRGFYQSDQFETNQVYPVNSNLYCSEKGLLTTRRPSPIHPAIAITTAPPTPISSFLEFMWY